uniref:Ig-like domain-containing protein n=1 Tax=Erpetoichthys calabaricus TaxID=27687 RepID=A0A8C4XCE9_ERPCA
HWVSNLKNISFLGRVLSLSPDPYPVKGITLFILVECFYNVRSSNFVKYWCREDNQGNCEILCKTNTPQKNGDRIIISDNQTHGVLTLTINKVERSDVGTYWCGIEKLGLNAKASVTLKVLKGFYIIFSFCLSMVLTFAFGPLLSFL